MPPERMDKFKEEWVKDSPELKELDNAEMTVFIKREWKNCKLYNRKPDKRAAALSAGPSNSREGTKKARIADILNTWGQESNDQPSDEHPT